MPVSPPLTTTESGTATSVRPTNTLEFNGADFTVTGTGDKATISIDSTGTGAALTATQVGFGNASNLLTGSTKLTWNDTVGAEQLKVMGSGTTDGGIYVENTNAGTISAPDLVLYRNSTSPADNDFIGRFDMRGKNASGADVNYLMMTMKIQDASEDAGRLNLFVSGNAALNSDDAQLMIFGRTGLTGNPGLVSINNSARSDVDFRVSGDTNANLIRTDASLDGVGIGVAPPSSHGGITVRMTIQGDNDDIALMLQNEGTDADDGPEMVFYRNSSSPAVNDLLGRIRFDGEDSGGNVHTYFRMTNQIKDPTDGNEDGNFYMTSRQGGALYDVMKFNGAMIEMNPNSAAQVDVWIKGDNDNILFADASQDNLGIGTSAPSSGVERLHVKGTGASTLVKMESTDAGATQAPDIVLYRNTASPAADDVIGSLQWTTNASDGSEYVAAKIESKIVDTTAGSENAKLQFYGGDQGGNQLVFEINGAADLVVNPDSNGFRDFSVKSANVTTIFSDSSQDNVGIGGNPDSGVERLHVIGTDASKDLVMFESNDTDGNDDGPDLVLYRSKESPGDGTQLGSIKFRGRNNATADIGYAHIEAEVESGFGTSANGLLRLGVVADGTSPTDIVYVSGAGSTPNVGIGGAPDSAGSQLQVDSDASFLRPVNTTQHASNHDVTVVEAHGYVLIGKTTSGTCNFNLPDAVAGMHLRIINIGSGINVVTATGDSLNGVTNSGSTATLAASITGTGTALDLVCIADNAWIANSLTAPAAT